MEPTSFTASRLSESIPSQLKYDMSKKISSLVVGKEQVVVYPTGGASQLNFNNVNQKNDLRFNISSTPYMADPRSVALLVDFQLIYQGVASGAGNDVTMIQDNFCPWFETITTLMGGMVHSNILQADLLTHFLTHQMTRDNYKTKATFTNPGLTRFRDGVYQVSPEEGAGGQYGSYTAPASTAQLSRDFGWSPLDVLAPGDQQGSESFTRSLRIPLQFIPLFSGSTFLPPQAMGNVELRFKTNPLSRIFSFVKTTGASNTNPCVGGVMTNIRLVYDSIQVADSVLDMIRSMSSVSPIHIPCVHYYAVQDNQPTNGPNLTPQQINLNLATSNLTNVFHYYLEQDQLSQATAWTYNKNPGYGPNSAVYHQIGNITYPSVNRSLGVNQIYHNYEEASNSGLCTSYEYYAPIQSLFSPPTGLFRIGINFERLAGSIYEGAVSSGVSTKASAGLIRAFLQASDVAIDNTGSPRVSTLTTTDVIVSVFQFLEYVLISSSGITTTAIV